jgi:3-hexulose-6-phosphate synthase
MRLQYAIDVLDGDEALALAATAVDAGVACVEVGHVLVKVCGVEIIREMRRRVDSVELVADMKTMDMGADEVRVAADAGADLVIVCAGASDGTIEAALSEGSRSGVQILVSLMGVRDRVRRAQELLKLGVDRIIAHRGIDDCYQWSEPLPFADVSALLELDGVRVALAGGLTSESVTEFAGLGFDRMIVGRGITAARDPSAAARSLVELVEGASSRRMT